jgi:hypothetical protein
MLNWKREIERICIGFSLTCPPRARDAQTQLKQDILDALQRSRGGRLPRDEAVWVLVTLLHELEPGGVEVVHEVPDDIQDDLRNAAIVIPRHSTK